MANLADILISSSSKYPDKVAIRYLDREFTYAELEERANRLASALLKMGVTKHDHVALISPNSSRCLELMFATARLGVVLEQYNVRLAAQIISKLLKRSGAKVVFFSSHAVQDLSTILSTVETLSETIQMDRGKGGSESQYELLLRSSKPFVGRTESSGENAAMLLYTSGTTGIPSGVLISHDAIAHQMEVDTAISKLNHRSVQLCVLPLYHVTMLSALETIKVGGELVIASECKGFDIAHATKEYGVTHISLVPFLLKALTSYIEESNMQLDTLEFILYGGESIDAFFLKRAEAALKCSFAQGYGMTETTAAITMLLPEHHKQPGLLSTVGKAVSGAELKILTANGTVGKSGEIGEILVKTPAIMLGYYKDPEKTAQRLKQGWYYTGDIGYLNEEGFLSLVARKDDMIISGGENIYPQEVNACIGRMSEIAESIVLGVPHEHWGEALVAVVVKNEGASISEQDVIERCRIQLGPIKKPNRVIFVDKLERNSSGKILKENLNKLVNASF